MSIQFVLGNSGGGKTYDLYSRILEESMQHPKKKYLIVVPEQFTMSTQKKLVSMHPGHSILNVDILSFGRLSYRIQEELGSVEGIVLEDTGKNFLLRRILSRRKEELKILKGNVKRMAYIDEVKSFLTELMQYRVSPEQLLTYRDGVGSNTLKMKIEDIYLIYTDFLNELGRDYITAEGRMEYVQGRVKDSAWLKDSVMVFDGFTGFTPIQNDLLEELMKVCEKIYITATMERDDSPERPLDMHNLFYMSHKYVETTLQIARKAGCKVEAPIWCTKGQEYRFKGEKSLYFLEQNLFRNKRVSYEEVPAGISIHNLPNTKSELEFACETIRELVRKEGYRFRDFALVSGDAKGYGAYVEEVFGNYEIPFFLDQTTNVVFHPLMECMSSILDVIAYDFSDSSIIAFLKCGLYNIDEEDIYCLENYLLALGYRHKYQWEKKWLRRPNGESEEELARLNAIRERLLEDFAPLFAVFSGEGEEKLGTISKQTEQIYAFLKKMDVGRQLLEQAEYFAQNKDDLHAQTSGRIYRAVLQVLEKMVSLLGEEQVNALEYKELLDAGFRGTQIARIPEGTDCVLIGDIERTRLDEIKILFFIGVNEGVIPSSGGSGGILSEMERSSLLRMNADIAFGARERTLVQRFYLYLNMTKPKERLYLTYARKNGKQEALEASFLIELIKSLYPNLFVEFHPDQEQDYSKKPANSQKTLIRFANLSRELVKDAEAVDPLDWLLLYQWLLGEQAFAEKTGRILRGAAYPYEELPLTEELSQGLYGQKLFASVSKLEAYQNCAFCYFLNYGLKIKKRRIHQVEASDVGNILHDAMNAYTGLVLDNGYTLQNVPEDRREGYLSSAMEEARRVNGESPIFDDERSKFLLYRLERIFRKTVETVTGQLKAGSFETALHEAEFRKDYRLENGEMTLVGKIDRVDLANKEDEISVRVIDYKSSERELELSKLYYGLSLQLMTYLNAAVEETKKENPEKKVLPAGVLYYGMTNPIMEAVETPTREELEENQRMTLRMKGYINSDWEIIEQMHAGLEGKSDVVPLKTKYPAKTDDGSAEADLSTGRLLDPSSKVLTTEEFETLQKYTDDKIMEIANKIQEGRIDINPLAFDEKGSSCMYCDFKGICGIDPEKGIYSRQTLEKLNKEEVFERIRDGQSAGEEV